MGKECLTAISWFEGQDPESGFAGEPLVEHERECRELASPHAITLPTVSGASF
ncbi:uncharacterized protein DNG_07227 [Cephalotrichum gorgonifer]|uniref:Uncharacterized protein n=1 Tax=Cephalotrichum gorgonifer TaxID=2041049 RepID=A0AAE8N464_9PEZI|nr:uncharacterized protein DNG_07227 [Cephalotrichum gorgonifer]